jgi:hypothetical protein
MIRLVIMACAVLGLPFLVRNLKTHKALPAACGLGVYWLGGLLNFLASSLNGWRMPVMTDGDVSGAWQVATPATRLPWLIDRFSYMHGDYLTIFSIGDVLILSGAVLTIAGVVYWAVKRLQSLNPTTSLHPS